jgi:hypothetical protein
MHRPLPDRDLLMAINEMRTLDERLTAMFDERESWRL